MALGKKTGGRKKGSKNKRKAALDQAIAEAAKKIDSDDPVDLMLAVMRQRELPIELRFAAAKAAAPYRHPKLAAIKHSGADGGPIRLSVEDLQTLTDDELSTLESIVRRAMASGRNPCGSGSPGAGADGAGPQQGCPTATKGTARADHRASSPATRDRNLPSPEP